MQVKLVNQEIVVNQKTLNNLTKDLCEFFRVEHGFQLSKDEMLRSLEKYLEVRIYTTLEGLPEELLSPNHEQHHQFKEFLPKGDIFHGLSGFSFNKLAAVVGFFIRIPNQLLSKTKLNKLAFYSDFLNFKRTGKSITGAEYKHLPYGPVIDDYEGLLRRLESEGYIESSPQLTSFGKKLMFLKGSAAPIVLSSEEIETLKSVEEMFGQLSAEEISELSHQEAAYRNTKVGESINYLYSKVMQH